MSRDWFDPFGVRGSRFDPLAAFVSALKGQGPSGVSAEFVATTIARRIVGRTIRIDAGIEITATVEAVDEAKPPTPLASLPVGAVEVPMWERVRFRLRDVEFERPGLGSWRLQNATLDVRDVRLVGAAARSISVGHVHFSATILPEEVVRWARAVDGDHRVRVHHGRLEASSRRIERWVWIEVEVAALDREVVVSPRALRVFGRALPLPPWLRREVRRPAPWLPPTVSVASVGFEDDDIVLRGEVSMTRVPVDIPRFLTDLGTEGAMIALRRASGGR